MTKPIEWSDNSHQGPAVRGRLLVTYSDNPEGISDARWSEVIAALNAAEPEARATVLEAVIDSMPASEVDAFLNRSPR